RVLRRPELHLERAADVLLDLERDLRLAVLAQRARGVGELVAQRRPRGLELAGEGQREQDRADEGALGAREGQRARRKGPGAGAAEAAVLAEAEGRGHLLEVSGSISRRLTVRLLAGRRAGSGNAPELGIAEP